MKNFPSIDCVLFFLFFFTFQSKAQNVIILTNTNYINISDTNTIRVIIKKGDKIFTQNINNDIISGKITSITDTSFFINNQELILSNLKSIKFRTLKSSKTMEDILIPLLVIPIAMVSYGVYYSYQSIFWAYTARWGVDMWGLTKGIAVIGLGGVPGLWMGKRILKKESFDIGNKWDIRIVK